MKKSAWALLAVATIGPAPGPALAAFRCPAADVAPTGVKPTLRAADAEATDDTVSTTLRSIVHRMQAEGLKSGDIVDRLVVADCSRIDADSTLSAASKASQVRRFASKLATVIYAGSGADEEDIVVQVPVPTSLYDRLHRAAAKAGLSEDAWITQAIATDLARR